MADLIQSVQDMLKEETWTRATISNYTQNNLIELANIVEKAKNENCENEIKAICEEHLTHTKDSIIALYICGILDLKNSSLDNSPLETLVDIFQKNHKENIVSYLCESILVDDPNNKFALRTLAEGYIANNNEAEAYKIYEKIVKVDHSEADLAKLLADYYEKAGNIKEATEYYRKAILRFVNQSNYNACKEIWSKLVQLIPQEIDFFQLVCRKIAKTMGESKTANLMQELYNWYKDNKKWDIAISILKQNLEIDSNDMWARKELADCYRGKYKENARVEDYIRASNLTQSYRNVFEAINDFEKHIAFDKDKYVFHRNWGVGQIKSLENDTLKINFGRTGGKRKMKLSMAVSSLQPLANDHIWVLKALDKDGELTKKIKADKKWALKTIIQSFDNNCDFKRIKAELVSDDKKTPSLLTNSEWTSWSTQAKKILENDSEFGVNPNDVSMYTVRDHEINREQKLADEFKAQKQFFARVEILMKYFNDENTDKTNELFAEMFASFTGYLKSYSKVNEIILASYLIVDYITSNDETFENNSTISFEQLYKKIESPRDIYTLLKDTKNAPLREWFIAKVSKLPDWAEQYIYLFPTVLDMSLLDKLEKENKTEEIQKLVRTSYEQYKDYRDCVLFLFKNCQDKEWYKTAGISYEEQMITLINLIVLSFREINNHVNSTENKKIQKNAIGLLFNDTALFKYLKDNDVDVVSKMYTLVDDVTDLDPIYKQQTRNVILEKYPDFKFRISEEKIQQQSNGMIVTKKMYDIKIAEAEKIQKEELPANAQDIADAKAKGDLKENSEYKAAIERQHYLSLKLSKLQSEIGRAEIFDPTTVSTSKVSFGTVVKFTNNLTNSEVTYTILGPWESDPDNNVLSYVSPLGNKILDSKVGDNLKFSINDTKYDLTVKSIEKAPVKSIN